MSAREIFDTYNTKENTIHIGQYNYDVDFAKIVQDMANHLRKKGAVLYRKHEGLKSETVRTIFKQAHDRLAELNNWDVYIEQTHRANDLENPVSYSIYTMQKDSDGKFSSGTRQQMTHEDRIDQKPVTFSVDHVSRYANKRELNSWVRGLHIG